jgi:hypothetical protein
MVPAGKTLSTGLPAINPIIMNKILYCFLPAALFVSMQSFFTNVKDYTYLNITADSNRVIMDTNDIRIFLEAKKTILYTVGNIVYAADKRDKNKQYIDGYEILGSSKLSNKRSLSLKMFLLNSNNCRFEVSRCSFFPRYCLSFSSRAGSLNFFLPENSSCNVITVVKVNSIGNKEMEFSFSKEILDQIKKSSGSDK